MNRHLADDADAITHAHGVVLATLESLLIRKGVLAPGELSGHVEMMARVTAETDDQAADILETWAGMLAEVDAAKVGVRQ